MLASAHQHNADLVKQGFGITDAHITVLQMISHDIATGSVRMKPMHPVEVEWYISRHEEGLPLVDWYDWLEGRVRPRLDGQYLDLEWYHDQYNTVSRFLAFILWVGKVTVINKDNHAQTHQG